MHKIELMFELQKQLNDTTNGTQWRDGLTQEGRAINWHRCIYMEVCEAIDSLNWKHWKDIDCAPNLANLRVELVDVWHFIMSELIRTEQRQYADKFLNIQPNETPVNSTKLIQILEELLAVIVNARFSRGLDFLHQATDLFFKALSEAEMGTDALYRAYVVKNQLNIFRQNHGYKNGTYLKIWGAIEDNEIAFNLMKTQPDLTPAQLYQKLEDEYTLA